MSVARNASATTSLPNPAALTPAGTGRSNVDSEPPLAGRAFALSLLLLDTVFGWSSTARRAERWHPTGLRALLPAFLLSLLLTCLQCLTKSSAGTKGEIGTQLAPYDPKIALMASDALLSSFLNKCA